MVDMARLEVFKGPQGTQFGKSAMAGAVRFVSNEPDTSAFAANINGSFNKLGSSDEMTNQLEGFVNLPVTDTIALRVAGYRHDNAGFIDVDGNTTFRMPIGKKPRAFACGLNGTLATESAGTRLCSTKRPK